MSTSKLLVKLPTPSKLLRILTVMMSGILIGSVINHHMDSLRHYAQFSFVKNNYKYIPVTAQEMLK